MRVSHILVSTAAAAACGLLLAGPAVSAERRLRVTVYNDNLGLVSDQRTLTVGRGQSEVLISDVPALIDPTSVLLRAEKGGLSVLEQNFQYDLASPDRILQRYLDQQIEVVLEKGDLKNGVLLSYDGGALVLREGEGGLSIVSREQVVDIRLPGLPSGLRTRPTLVWRVQSSAEGAAPVELSYTTSGLSWHAEYVAVTDEKDTSIDLSAWVSLDNQSGATFEDAELQLVAGEVHRVRNEAAMDGMQAMRAPKAMLAMDESRGFEEESFFEYHLYTLDRRTTLADRETKQVSLFPTTHAPVRKIYEYDGQRSQKDVAILLETENKADLGLGMPLPRGTVRTYKKDSRGLLQFVGEDQIDHTPKNEKVRLRLGNAFDVVGERKDLETRRVSDRVEERTVEIRIRNRKTEAIQVLVREHLWGDWTITESTAPSVKKDATTAEFQIPVEADQEAVLSFTVRTRW